MDNKTVIAFLCLLIAIAACSSPRSPPAASMQIEMEQPAVAMTGPAQLTFTVRDASGTPVEGAQVAIIGDMSHAGMKKVYAAATSTGNGIYQTTDFAFTMAGDWIITAEVTHPDGTKDSKVFTINGVLPTPGEPMGAMAPTLDEPVMQE